MMMAAPASGRFDSDDVDLIPHQLDLHMYRRDLDLDLPYMYGTVFWRAASAAGTRPLASYR